FAWEGASNGHPLRIEATTLRGHVTSFTTIAPWKNPVTNVGTTRSRTLVARFGYAFGSLLLMSTLVIAAVLARRNIRRGRGDRRGAFRVATVVFCASLAYWMLRMRHATDLPNEWNELSLQLALALFSAASVWVFYMAAEPYLRRRWPRTLIAWNRLFAGRFDDPMVGRDLLIGIVAGAVFATVHLASVLIVDALGVPIRIPWMQIWALNGLRTTLGTIAEAIEWSTGAALTLAVFVLLLQLVLRKRVVALAVAAVLVAPIITMAGNHGLIEVLVNIALAGMMMFVFARLGILALCALLATQSLLFSAALTLDPSSWYFALGLVSVAPLVLGAAWGAWTAMAKQPVFRALVLEE
ncbi:MAG TPA: hypothetical protein VF698_05465, partial [Thermoanaerobaculia bacterium]